MKSAVPWILIVALLGGGFFLYSANKDKDAQIAKLTQDTADVDGLRKENDELKKQSVTPDEVARRKCSSCAMKSSGCAGKIKN